MRPDGDVWVIRWIVANDGDEPIRIVRAAAPDRRFRADEQDAAAEIPAGGEAEVALPVQVERDGGDVENASLVLQVRSGEADWRIHARLQVRRADGMPQPRTQQIDVDEGS